MFTTSIMRAEPGSVQLQTDAYTCYSVHEGVHLGCMTHVRRYFFNAKKQYNHILRMIGNLYRIERELKKMRSKLADEDRHKKD